MGRVAETNTATVDCSLNAPDWKRLGQEANATPAGRAQLFAAADGARVNGRSAQSTSTRARCPALASAASRVTSGTERASASAT